MGSGSAAYLAQRGVQRGDLLQVDLAALSRVEARLQGWGLGLGLELGLRVRVRVGVRVRVRVTARMSHRPLHLLPLVLHG